MYSVNSESKRPSNKMSTNGIGRADDLEKYWSPALSEETDRLEIESKKESHADPVIEDYPFSQQLIISGDFSYNQPGRRGYSPKANGTYEYRTASGLFLVNIRQQNPESEKVFEEINSAISESARVKPIKSVDKESLWEFFQEADQIVDAEFSGPEGRLNLREYLQSQNNSEGESENDLKDYLLLSVKASYTPPGADSPVIVNYDRGKFQIPKIEQDGSEYVIQLLEKHLLHEA